MIRRYLVAFANSDISLEKYRCAKCGKTPENAHEVFRGCKCGHRSFRILTNEEKKDQNFKHKDDLSQVGMDFLTVRERGVGIYDINVEKLLDGKKDKSEQPVIAGNKGIFSIHLTTQKPKQKRS